jgi:hypothetical protein
LSSEKATVLQVVMCKLFVLFALLQRRCCRCSCELLLFLCVPAAVFGVAVFLVRACLSSENATVLQIFDMQAVWCCCFSCACLFVLRKCDSAADF